MNCRGRPRRPQAAQSAIGCSATARGGQHHRPDLLRPWAHTRHQLHLPRRGEHRVRLPASEQRNRDHPHHQLGAGVPGRRRALRRGQRRPGGHCDRRRRRDGSRRRRCAVLPAGGRGRLRGGCRDRQTHHLGGHGPTGATLRTITVEVTDGTATTVQKQFTVLVTDPVRLAHAGMLRQFWSGIGGYAVSALTADTRYPAKPDSTSVVPSAATPTNTADNFGDRLTGYLRPSVTGSYTFYLAANEAGELRLGPTSDPTSLSGAPIASLTSSATVNEWTKYPTQKSVAVTLVAGRCTRWSAAQGGRRVGSCTDRLAGPGHVRPRGDHRRQPVDARRAGQHRPGRADDAGPEPGRRPRVTVSWTAGTDANGISGYRVYRDGAPIGSVGSAARSYTDAGVTGRHDYAVVAVDAYGNTSAPTTLAGVDSATAFNAVEQAVASGSAAASPTGLAGRRRPHDHRHQQGPAAGRQGQAVQLSTPTAPLRPTVPASPRSAGLHPRRRVDYLDLRHQRRRPSHQRRQRHGLHRQGSRDRRRRPERPGRYLVLGGNPMRTALASAPNAATTDAGMHKFLENSMSWLTGRDDLTAAPFRW